VKFCIEFDYVISNVLQTFKVKCQSFKGHMVARRLMVYSHLGDKTFGRKTFGRKIRKFGRQRIYLCATRRLGEKRLGDISGTFRRKLLDYIGRQKIETVRGILYYNGAQ